MTSLCKPLNESTLNVNLNEVAHSLVRELAMACKKVGIYGAGHPSADRAVEKPFFVLDHIFGFKRYAGVNLQNGHLYILNIRVKESVFSAELIKYMQILDVRAILFERGVTMAELGAFIGRFVRRINTADHRNLLSSFLRDNGIDTIEVNTENALNRFESARKYRGDVDGDFSLKAVVSQCLGDDIVRLADIAATDDGLTDEFGIDYDTEVVHYVIPEKVSSLPSGIVRNELTQLVRRIEASQDETERGELVRLFAEIDRLLYYHPQRDEIIENLEESVIRQGFSQEEADELRSPVGRIKAQSSERIEELLSSIFAPGNGEVDAESFTEAFERLRKTGQMDRAQEVFSHLLDLLGAANSEFRQKALGLLLDVVRTFDLEADESVTRRSIDQIVAKLAEKKETFEYSEFIWQVLQKCLRAKKYALAAILTTALALRRRIARDVTVYDSITVKKVFDSFDQSVFIPQLVYDLTSADFETASRIREILVATGSEAVAMELSKVISHPKRQIRQQALKVLGELGKASLNVFSQILADDAMFRREEGCASLSNERWYVIRNSIFVMGLLEDAGAISYLKMRISDPDVRVRHEIIRALEKIGGEEACDLLMMMANDPSEEVRDLAVITIGLIGSHDVAPLLIDLAQANPPVTLKAISALGKLGGRQAEAYLIRALEDSVTFAGLVSTDVSRDDLSLAVIKALGQIGDQRAIDSIKEFKNSQSTAQKLFFKNSPVNRAISQIISQR